MLNREKTLFVKILAVLLPGLFLCQALFAEEYPWKLRIKEDGITVYSRKVEGSPILEFKADVVIDAPLDKVISFYQDITKVTSWYYQCVKAERMGIEGPEGQVLYFVIDLPWPVTTRDSVIRQARHVDPSSGVVTYSATPLPELRPVEKGMIRVKALKSIWKFTPLAGDRTEVYFQQHSDPGGMIPAFLVNKLVVDMPFNSLRNMRKMILNEAKKQPQ